jgi:hypothetical protein
MDKKKWIALVVFTITTASILCMPATRKNNRLQQIENDCCIDTFKIKYQITLGGGKVRKIDYNIYVGMLSDTYQIGGKKFRKMVFGDSLNAVLAFVREDEDYLNYLNLGDSLEPKETTLLYFNKEVNDKWEVNIDNSYFWRKEITFAGIEKEGNENVYVYNVQTNSEYTSVGDEITKIYYSKQNGFLKFMVKTHWGNIEAIKAK